MGEFSESGIRGILACRFVSGDCTHTRTTRRQDLTLHIVREADLLMELAPVDRKAKCVAGVFVWRRGQRRACVCVHRLRRASTLLMHLDAISAFAGNGPSVSEVLHRVLWCYVRAYACVLLLAAVIT